jgi:hypothetical protein
VLKEALWQGELTHFVLDVEKTIVRVVATRPPAALPRTGSRIDLFFSPSDACLIPEDSIA